MKFAVAVILLIALSAVAVVAQPEAPCDSPKVWEGRQAVTVGSRHDARMSRLYYDETQERVATLDEIFNDGQNRTFYHTILLHQTKKMYLIDLSTKKCEVRDIDFPFRPFGIPKNATFFGSDIIGSDAVPGAGVQVERWGIHKGEEFFWEGVVTEIGCLPIHDIFYDKRVGIVHTDFFNLELGISRPDVFTPPAECAQ